MFFLSIDCTLIYPYLEDANWKNELRSKDNLALGYLTSCLRQEGFSVSMIHAEHNKYSVNDIIKILKKNPPKCVGISCTSQRSYVVVKEYAKYIKSNFNIPIFIGGIFPTIAYDKILNDCHDIDVISLGEGEISTVKYLKHIIGKMELKDINGISFRDSENKIIANYPISVIENLDELPLPAKDFFEDMEKELKTGFYYINISAGRGCYGNCSFCSTGKLTGTSYRRVRSVGNVLDEIEHFQKKYNVNYFKFVDELFIDKTNLTWIYDFCNQIKKRNLKIKFHAEARVDCILEPVIANLKSVGLDELFIGLESGNQSVLNKYRKGHTLENAENAIKIIKKYDINLQLGYIMIDPSLTFEQLHENIMWILKVGNYSKHNLYNKLNLYYGTDLYYSMKKSQINDNSPFYERKISYFIDNRVEAFSKLIDYTKLRFTNYNKTINEFLLQNIKDGLPQKIWKSYACQIDNEEVKVWTNIILNAFDLSKEGNIDMEKWNKYIDNDINFLYEKFTNITKH